MRPVEILPGFPHRRPHGTSLVTALAAGLLVAMIALGCLQLAIELAGFRP